MEAGAPSESPRPKESIFGLARQLVSGVIGLARLEVQHGRAEIGAKLSRLPGVAIRLGLGVAFVLMFLIALVVFIVLGVAALTGLPEWLIALGALFLFLGIGILFLWLGFNAARGAVPQPKETIASVQEDIAWLKRLLRRD